MARNLRPLVVAAFGAAFAAAAFAQVAVQAQLSAVTTEVKPVKATASLPVLALPVDRYLPVREGTVLGELDLAKLEKSLREATDRLEQARSERRRMTTDRGVARPGSSGSNRDTAPAGAWQEMSVETAEADATREMVEAQTRLSEAPVRAPRDGYVLDYFYPVGSTSKKRKPFLDFVGIDSTRVTVTLAAAEAAPFAAGVTVRLSDPSDPAAAFRGRIESVAPAGDRVALTVRPLDLPFLTLDTATPATLELAP